MKDLNPELVYQRLTRVRQHRGRWRAPGPNYMWCMDAHLKLQFWGIEIYAAIDAYSRYVIWVYLGIFYFISYENKILIFD